MQRETVKRQGYKDLKTYQLAYKLAMEIFVLTKTFPKEERYALTDQIRRSSRSVPANLAEGYRKRQYSKMFLSKLSDCDGEIAETKVWIDFAYDCGYLDRARYQRLADGYEELGKMFGGMIAKAEDFAV
jgi:four helix bundle protein